MRAFDENELVVLVNNGYGIYQAQACAKMYTIEGIDSDDIDILLSGPNNSGYDHGYYEVWEELLNNGRITLNGVTYSIFTSESNDLLGIPVDMDFPEDF